MLHSVPAHTINRDTLNYLVKNLPSTRAFEPKCLSGPGAFKWHLTISGSFAYTVTENIACSECPPPVVAKLFAPSRAFMQEVSGDSRAVQGMVCVGIERITIRIHRVFVRSLDLDRMLSLLPKIRLPPSA